MPKLEQGEDVKGLAGELVGEALSQRAKEDELDFTATQKSVGGNCQISRSPLKPSQQLKAETLIVYLQRRDTSSVVMARTDSFVLFDDMILIRHKRKKLQVSLKIHLHLHEYSQIPVFHGV